MNPQNMPQPAPLPAHKPLTHSAHWLVMADLADRASIGLQKYQTVLTADNGRDHLLDAYQELLDLAAYLRLEIAQRQARAEPLTIEAMAERLQAAGYGLIPPHAVQPPEVWPDVAHPVEPPLPAEELAARLHKVSARVERVIEATAQNDTLYTRAVKAWQAQHGQEIGKMAGAGGNLKADLRGALHASGLHLLAQGLETLLYAEHAHTLRHAGLALWFALPGPITTNGTQPHAPTVLDHCRTADIARQGLAVESEILALLREYAIDPGSAYAQMARVLADCAPERWPVTEEEKGQRITLAEARAQTARVAADVAAAEQAERERTPVCG